MHLIDKREIHGTRTGQAARNRDRLGSGTLTIDGANVSINEATMYVKRSAAAIQAVANGQCMSARGTNDGSGTLQATTAMVRARSTASARSAGSGAKQSIQQHTRLAQRTQQPQQDPLCLHPPGSV